MRGGRVEGGKKRGREERKEGERERGGREGRKEGKEREEQVRCMYSLIVCVHMNHSPLMTWLSLSEANLLYETAAVL